MPFDLPVSPGFLTITETARSARTSYRTVCRWLASGELRFSRFGQRRYVHYADLDRFLRERG